MWPKPLGMPRNGIRKVSALSEATTIPLKMTLRRLVTHRTRILVKSHINLNQKAPLFVIYQFWDFVTVLGNLLHSPEVYYP